MVREGLGRVQGGFRVSVWDLKVQLRCRVLGLGCVGFWGWV